MYNLSDSRTLSVEGNKLNVIIKDDKRSILIPAKRWAVFVKQFDEIDNAVKQLREKQYVKYFEHIGGGWYVSINTGFQCIDIRRFYKKDGEIKPTRDGLALRLSEWLSLQLLVITFPVDQPALVAVQPCYYATDHQNLMGYLECPECTPYDHA